MSLPEEKKETSVSACALADEELEILADLFKAFGDVTRIRILSVLSEQEICVNDLAGILGMTQSAISHQLKILKQNRLIRGRRDGKLIYYSLDDNHVHTMLEMGIEHITE